MYTKISGVKACPISRERIDVNILRLSGIFLLYFLLQFFYTKSVVWLFLLSGEFTIRAFFGSKYAPLFLLSKIILKKLKIAPLFEDAAPKKFAVKIGFSVSNLMILFYFFSINKAFYMIGVILLICIGLEVLFQFCVGCVIYSWILKIKKISKI